MPAVLKPFFNTEPILEPECFQKLYKTESSGENYNDFRVVKIRMPNEEPSTTRPTPLGQSDGVLPISRQK